jgi:hypothetical protein
MINLDNDNERESFGSDDYGRESFEYDSAYNMFGNDDKINYIINNFPDIEKRLKKVEDKLNKVSGGNRKHKTRSVRKIRNSRKMRKSRKNKMKNRGKGKEWKTTPITDKKELQRLEEYDKRAAERERNNAEINRIHAELDMQRNNVLSGLIGTPMDAKEVERQRREDEQHSRRVNSKKAKERKLTIYDL